MGIADDLVGRTLQGRGRNPNRWHVHEKVASIQGHSPGFFSVAYKCRNDSGTEAFLKASDLSKVLSSNPNDTMKLLLDAAQAHNFERDILEHCRGNRMDRVVTALDFGNENVVHEGNTDFLFFLVFELADGDLRRRITQRQKIDLIWTTSALHEYAVAVSQLHNGSVFHNDIKPANALVFGNGGQKIADLGRATTPLMAVAHDYGQCVGDMRFAAPEQLYMLRTPTQHHERFEFYRAGDLYNLGSLAHYLLVGTSMTQEIVSRLKPEFRPPSSAGGWGDYVDLVLPYWQTELGQILQEARSVTEEFKDDSSRQQIELIVTMIGELCEPDWKRRGDRLQIGKANQYDIARYISRLDLARTKVLIASKYAK